MAWRLSDDWNRGLYHGNPSLLSIGLKKVEARVWTSGHTVGCPSPGHSLQYLDD